ncbi:BA75_04889T0 [Komagataella pastoris]|uniref:BA75_04889T0 n=1 Tax=Komagataella pastoris TaxID=4922 RepID=A0A1B2JH29_PICPA|nr:BA75_04889T0 [Komagataella pastoris]
MLNSTGGISNDDANIEDNEIKIPKSSFDLSDDEDDEVVYGDDNEGQAEPSNNSKETEQLSPSSIKIALIKELSPLRIEPLENTTKIQDIIDQNDREVNLAFALDDEEFNVLVPSQEEQ